MKYEIRNRFTGKTQFTAEIDCDESASIGVKVGLAVRWAIENTVNLSGANLSGANLYGANLSGVDLYGVDLSRANLSGANLYGANLSRVDLSGANLSGANLYGANLSRVDLSRVDLRGGIYRTDGYQFWIIQTDDGPHIRAGCRWLSLPDARKHWQDTRGGTPLGDETMRILDFLEFEAKAAGWLK